MRSIRFGTVLALAVALSIPALASEVGVSRRILLVDGADEAYRNFGGAPDSGDLHLVVVEDGRLVGDHVLQQYERTATERDDRGRLLRVESIARDDAWISEDERIGVIARARFVADRPIGGGDREADPDDVRFRSRELSLEWIDADHPNGRWAKPLPDGTSLGAVRLLDSGLGVAVVVLGEKTSAFVVLSQDGRVLSLQRDLIPTNPTIRVDPSGWVLAVDLAFAPRPGLPDRAVHVVDLASGATWSYAWSYGSDQEPVSWEFADDGTLRFVTAGIVYRYRPDGRPIGSERRR